MLTTHAVLAQEPSYLLPPGALSTRGSQIVSQTGDPVRILAVGVFTDVSNDARRIVNAGFNTLRVEWSNRTLEEKLPQLDLVVASAGRVGLKVILDNHYNEGLNDPCSAQQANGLWYSLGGASDDTDGCATRGTVTDARFVKDWERVALHYKSNETVIGYDLRNEPLAYPGMSTWEPGCQNQDHNIRCMYERVGNAILAIDPEKLIICEGPQNYKHAFADRSWPAPWGDLSLAGELPVNLLVPNKLVYSVHDYPSPIAGYTPDSGEAKVMQMQNVWGYLVTRNIAPVWIGEMGSNMMASSDNAWAQTLIDYANGRLGRLGGPEFSSNQQGIGIGWWWAGNQTYSTVQPSGIFTPDGSLNERQQRVYRQFSYRRN